MTRGRANVAETDRHVSVNVLVHYDPAASLADLEDTVKRAARRTILRLREDFGPES